MDDWQWLVMMVIMFGCGFISRELFSRAESADNQVDTTLRYQEILELLNNVDPGSTHTLLYKRLLKIVTRDDRHE